MTQLAFPTGLMLRGPVGNGLDNDPEDVLAVKRHLRGLGLYIEPDYGMTGFIDRDTELGIRKFQEEQGLKADGILLPGGETEQALNMGAGLLAGGGTEGNSQAASFDLQRHAGNGGPDAGGAETWIKVAPGANGKEAATAYPPFLKRLSLLDAPQSPQQPLQIQRREDPRDRARVAAMERDRKLRETPYAERILNDEGYDRASVLPFRREQETGKFEFALPGFVASPFQAVTRTLDAIREGKPYSIEDAFEIALAITPLGVGLRGGSLNMGLSRPRVRNLKAIAKITKDLESKSVAEALSDSIVRKVTNPYGSRGGPVTQEGLDIFRSELQRVVKEHYSDRISSVRPAYGGTNLDTGMALPEQTIVNPKIATARKYAKDNNQPFVMPELGPNEGQFRRPDTTDVLTIRGEEHSMYGNAQRMNRNGSVPVKGERLAHADLIEFVGDEVVNVFPKLLEKTDREEYRKMLNGVIHQAIQKLYRRLGIETA